MTTIIAYEPNRTNSGFRNEHLNKQITALVNRNKFYQETIKDILNNNISGSSMFLAVDYYKNGKEKVVGLIIWSLSSRILCSMNFFLVDEKMRGNGIGTKLFETFDNYRKSQCINDCEIDFDDNDEKLVKLYTKLGFKNINFYRGFPNVRGACGLATWYKLDG